ncbi:hypothetical protein [Rhizobium leguminosarum]|uniref:hypothetical protein n=1 Tax=Rhizobium leguminosarum TaxID=384 RepID=UPI001C954DA7|nr:hypothetical protein [Rhizobium leguminosarum]MBY5494219.1 hypothetical protein [Rhizobium leguminosarum]
MTFYHFHWLRKEHADCLVLVTTLAEFDRQDLIDIIDQDILSGNPYPEALIVIAPADAAPAMSDALKNMIDTDALIRLPSETAIVLAAFDSRGQITAPTSAALQGRFELRSSDFQSIVHAGTLHLVSSRQAVLVAPHAHHFVHPRRRHSRAFFRTANTLIQGEEIGFLALVLLPFLGDQDEKVWVDSSSIAALVYAAYALKGRLSAKTTSIQIQSFLSYEGLDRLRIQDPSKELVLISATASGSLPEIVASKTKLPKNRVITLFSTTRQPSGTIVFDARETIKGLEPLMLETFEDTQCPWCRDGSRVITFVGDQFLADAATISAYTIVETAASPALRAVMKKYRGKDAFSLRQHNERAGHGLFVDLEHTLLVAGNRPAIRKLVQRNVPASTSHILPTSGKDSEMLAEIVADELRDLGLPRPEILSNEMPDETTRDRKGVVIVAATLGSGRSFQDASRDLRKPFNNLPRTYFAGVNKHSLAEYQGTLLKDLEHNNKEHKHIFCVVDAMTLPHENQYSTWAKELTFWRKVKFDLSMGASPKKVNRFVDQRIRILSRNIVGNNFFLPDTSDRPLELRPSFAFWDGDYKDEIIKQGDVFATIASILESRRKPSKTGQASALVQSPFHMNVLSSENFTRFNDGIIQASMLRAAFPHELSYAHATTANHSAKISHLIVKMLEHHADSQGEAVLEFLVALATRQLTLATVDLQRVAAFPKNRLPSLLAAILPYIIEENPNATNANPQTTMPA